jgi:hypothetical protein
VVSESASRSRKSVCTTLCRNPDRKREQLQEIKIQLQMRRSETSERTQAQRHLGAQFLVARTQRTGDRELWSGAEPSTGETRTSEGINRANNRSSSNEPRLGNRLCERVNETSNWKSLARWCHARRENESLGAWTDRRKLRPWPVHSEGSCHELEKS